jgi:hypothetical protein
MNVYLSNQVLLMRDFGILNKRRFFENYTSATARTLFDHVQVTKRDIGPVRIGRYDVSYPSVLFFRERPSRYWNQTVVRATHFILPFRKHRCDSGYAVNKAASESDRHAIDVGCTFDKISSLQCVVASQSFRISIA